MVLLDYLYNIAWVDVKINRKVVKRMSEEFQTTLATPLLTTGAKQR